MTIPSAIKKKAQELELEALQLRNRRHFDTARLLEDLAYEIREAVRLEAEQLLSTEAAVAYSRGYSSGYLRRTLTNYGTPRAALFRKGDIPRHPIRRKAA